MPLDHFFYNHHHSDHYGKITFLWQSLISSFPTEYRLTCLPLLCMPFTEAIITLHCHLWLVSAPRSTGQGSLE